MPADPAITANARVNQRFARGREESFERLFRELLDYAYALEAKMDDTDAIIASYEARLTAGGL